MNRITMMAAWLLGMWITSAIAASGLPEYYPDAFGNQGVINSVNTGESVLIIDDREIRYSVDLQVYTPDTKFETVTALRPGMRVGWGPNGVRIGRHAVISELWVLPANYGPSPRSR